MGTSLAVCDREICQQPSVDLQEYKRNMKFLVIYFDTDNNIYRKFTM